MSWPIRIFSVFAAFGACYLIQIASLSLKFNEQRLVALAGLYVTLAVSLNLINGITGQFSIGHAAFYQIGAYAAGFISIHYLSKSGLTSLPWILLMILVGAIFAGIAGFIVGLPSLRLRGDYLAIVTLGFGEIIRICIQNTKELGGSYALDNIPKIQMIWLIWLLAFVAIAVCRNLLKTAHGLAFLAVREDEVASTAMGVNVTKIKVTAFVLGSMFAGAAGALLAHYETSILPTTFSMDVSFILVTMVVLGGTGSITGSVIAAVSLFYLPEYLRGQPPVSGNSLAAAVVAVIAWVVAVKWLVDNYFGSNSKKFVIYLGVTIGAVLIKIALTPLFGLIPNLSAVNYEGDKLRMVIFAATLIILMLIRPQGIFAHHEFSWEWVKKLFKRQKPKVVEA